MRLDKAIFERGLAQSRSRAEQLLRAGSVQVNGVVETKPSRQVEESDVLLVQDTIGYVGRGGLKLEYALNEFEIDCRGKTALDIGASTGGFTQCLLRRGAEKVTAVDVGHGQMAPELAADERVCLLENTNARILTPAMLGGRAELAVMDVSFISQTVLYPAVFSCVEEEAPVITLVKPQFEAGGRYLNKKGVVKDSSVYGTVLAAVDRCAREFGRGIAKVCTSPILGGDGNTEFLVWLKKDAPPQDFQQYKNGGGILVEAHRNLCK